MDLHTFIFIFVLVAALFNFISGKKIDYPSWCTDCHKNAKCTPNRNGSYYCECNSGFEWNEVEGCEDINECHQMDNPCEIGICFNTIGSFACICDSETNQFSTTNKCIRDPCYKGRLKHCKNGGGCHISPIDLKPVCSCQWNYGGDRCYYPSKKIVIHSILWTLAFFVLAIVVIGSFAVYFRRDISLLQPYRY